MSIHILINIQVTILQVFKVYARECFLLKDIHMLVMWMMEALSVYVLQPTTGNFMKYDVQMVNA